MGTFLRCCLWAWLCLLSQAQAQPAPRTAQEADLQAMFVINFLRMAEWPAAAAAAAAAAPLVLCVDAMHEAVLLALQRSGVTTVQGRTLSLREIARGEPLRECHALLMDTAELRRTGPGQLTVGDAPGFTEAGGMLGLVRVENRLRFEANLEAAQRAQLRLSSELLKLALPPGGAGRRAQP